MEGRAAGGGLQSSFRHARQWLSWTVEPAILVRGRETVCPRCGVQEQQQYSAPGPSPVGVTPESLGYHQQTRPRRSIPKGGSRLGVRSRPADERTLWCAACGQAPARDLPQRLPQVLAQVLQLPVKARAHLAQLLMLPAHAPPEQQRADSRRGGNNHGHGWSAQGRAALPARCTRGPARGAAVLAGLGLRWDRCGVATGARCLAPGSRYVICWRCCGGWAKTPG